MIDKSVSVYRHKTVDPESLVSLKGVYPLKGKPLPFLWSIHPNKEKEIRGCLLSGANPNIHNRDGWTPLMISIYNGYNHLCRLLIEAGADYESEVVLINGSIVTPLQWARKYNKTDMLERFITLALDGKWHYPIKMCSSDHPRYQEYMKRKEYLGRNLPKAKSSNSYIERWIDSTY